MVEQIMWNPYKVGAYVEGTEFYGREKLIAQLLDGPDRAIWIIGSRRIGKTSLLYRLESVASASGRVVFNIAINRASRCTELAECLTDDLEEGDSRLQRLGLTLAELQGKQPHEIIRLLDRRARSSGVEVVLLVDEAEALIHVVKCEANDQVLKDLQDVIGRSQALRWVMSATRRLLELDEICKTSGWQTTRFLDPFKFYYLGRLESDASLALLRQSQAATPQPIDDAVATAILDATGGHPYLIQSLATELWSDSVIRQPQPGDMMPTPEGIWDRMFQEDYECLSDVERQIIRNFAEVVEPIDGAEVAARLGADTRPESIYALLAALEQMCYVRREGERYRIGSELLRHWLHSGLAKEPTPVVSNENATDSADQDQQNITAQIAIKQRRLGILEEQRARFGITPPPEIQMEIEDITKEVAELTGRLDRLRRRG